MKYLVVAENVVCEAPQECSEPAAAMVWVSHHIRGCNYTGYRCAIHLNLLTREVLTEMQRLERSLSLGHGVVCLWCGDFVESSSREDHLRWFRL